MSARPTVAFFTFLAVTFLALTIHDCMRERREAVAACIKLGRAPVECREAFDP